MSARVCEESLYQPAVSDCDYANLFQAFPQPMWVFDRESLRFLAVNHAAVKQYGYSTGDFLAMTTLQIETTKTGRHCTRDGALIDVQLSQTPTIFQGRPAEIVLAVNVTEERQAERERLLRYEVARIVSECGTIETAAPRILAAICRVLGWQYGALWGVDPVAQLLRQVADWSVDSTSLMEFRKMSEHATIVRGAGLPGNVWLGGAPLWLPDVLAGCGDDPRVAFAARAGLRGAFGVPIVMGGEILGVMDFASYNIQQPDAGLLEAMTSIGVKIGFYFERLKAQKDTQERETRFRRLFEESPVAYCEMDAGGIIRRVNRAECEMLGLPAEKLLGHPVWDLAIPEKRKEWIEFFRDPKAHLPLPDSVEIDYIRPDGVALTFAVYPRLMEANGNFAGIRSARLDITALKQAERERSEQRRFEELFSDITDAFVTSQDVDASLQHCAEALVWRLDGALARIWATNPAARTLELRASAGVYTSLEGPYSCIPFGETRVGKIAANRQPCLSNAVSGDPLFAFDWAKRAGLAGFAGYPLVVNDQTTGVLALFSRQPIADSVFQALGKAALEIAVVIERKTAEKALSDSEQRYRSVVETAAEGIWVADKEGRATFVNRRMGELLGSAPEDVIGKTGFDYVLEEDRELVVRTLASLERGNREVFDFRLLRPDGSFIWASLSAAPILDGENRFAGSLIMFTDVTHRKQVEDALRSSEEFNKGIVESTSDGILVLDSSAHFQYMSPAAKHVLDYEDEADGGAGSWLEFWTGANRKKLETALARGAAGENSSFEGSCLTVKGNTRILEVSLSAVRDRGGATPRLVAILRDIAARKQLEGQLTQALKLESIGQLAAGVAHEINTPIQYIGDNARFLQESFEHLRPMLDIAKLPEEYRSDAEFLSAEVPKAAEQLLEGVEHVARIVRAMKEFSHPGQVDKTPVDLNHAIQSTTVVSRNEWKYVAEMIEDFDWDLPSVRCMPGEINQVILNLIVNAAHAISDRTRGTETRGTITVSTRRDGDWAEIRVRDTGTGISESARGRVFDPFFTTKEVGKGTGQGLAIAHTVVVKNHGGTIRFESEVGQGTTFIVRLPIAGT